jgi:ABC-type transporter lipoprotein component MlaA
VINTVAGAGGLGDPAHDAFNLNPKTEDLGQTFGKWGVGGGIYFCWPILGPSNVRDTIGFVGDAFLSPLTYLAMSDAQAGLGAQVGERINRTSLSIGDYEEFKEASFDPYSAMRDFYYQNRRSKIEDKVRQGNDFSEAGEPGVERSRGQEVEKFRTANMLNSLMDLNNVEKIIGHGYLSGSRVLNGYNSGA